MLIIKELNNEYGGGKMEIGKVFIKNFRSIESLVLYPNEKNVIIGDSNCGKSTILKALDLALNPGIPYYRDLFSEYDFYNKQIDKPICIEITFKDLSQEELDHFIDYLEPGKDIDNIIEHTDDITILDEYQKYLRVEFKCEYLSEEYDYEFATYFCKQNNISERKRLSKKDKYMIGFQLIDPSKEVNKVANFSRNSAFNKLIKQNEISLKTEIGKIIEESLPEVSGTLHQNDDFDEIIKCLGEQITDFGFIEGIPDNLKFELANMTRSDLLRKLELFIQPEDGVASFPLSYHGTGLKNSIALSTALLLSELNEKGIIAIEEPETGLHPHAQEYLSHKLNNIESQVFVTTHSPDIADSFNLEDFILLNKINNKTKVNKPNFDDPTKEQIYKNAERYNKDELIRSFFGKAVLLVEGDTEKGAFPMLFAKLSQKEEYIHYAKLGINIVNVGTCMEMKNYGKVFKEMNIPVIAVLDNDPKKISGDRSNFIEGVKNNTDLTIILPKDDLFYDFEGIMCYESDFEILKKSLTEMINYKKNFDRVQRILCEAASNVNENLLNEMVNEGIDDYTDVLNYLNKFNSEDKYIEDIKKILKKVFELFKGARYAKVWTKNYQPKQIPEIINQLYGYIQSLLLENKGDGLVELKF